MATCSSADSVLEAASQIKSNAAKLNAFVNGTSSQTVQLGTGSPTPTLRKFMADAQDVVTQAALDAGQTVLDDVVQNKTDITALEEAVESLEERKADKFVPAEAGNLAKLSADGNLRDAGRAVEDFVPLLGYANNEAQKLAMFNYINDELRQHEDAIRNNAIAIKDVRGDSVPLLAYASNEAIELVWQNCMAVKHYREWGDEQADRHKQEADRHRRDMDRIADANIVAMQAVQDIRSLIDTFDESYTQHRLQIRLFDGTNPASSSKPVLFVVAGQSNAVGYGNYKPFASAKDCGSYWSWVRYSGDGYAVLDANDQSLQPLMDPTGHKSGRGSGWCDFARKFFALTGRKSILINFAKGGSSVFGNWNDNTAWGTTISGVLNSFHSVVSPSDYELGGIFWVQGETEAAMIYNNNINIGQYKNATESAWAWLRGESMLNNENCPVFLGKIGFQDSAISDSILKNAYKKIQSAQEELCDNETVFLGFSMAPYFIDAMNVYMSDGIHYSSYGYKVQGESFARCVVNRINF